MMYRKRPVVIEALQWDGSMNGMLEINKHWPSLVTAGRDTSPHTQTVFMWNIKTLEGQHRVSACDYIIKGVKGEFYPCKADIFAMTYESALAVPAPTQAQHLKAASQQALTVLRGCLEHPDAGDAISALQHAIAQPAKPATALTEAAQAVVARWDTPLWKDVPATGGFINALRDALEKTS